MLVDLGEGKLKSLMLVLGQRHVGPAGLLGRCQPFVDNYLGDVDLLVLCSSV